MKVISLFLILTVASMGCATAPRPLPQEPLAQATTVEPVAKWPPEREAIIHGQGRASLLSTR
jgi:hypothetical protein